MNNSPKHVALIMDGNRRWAKNHTASILMGHQSGSKCIEPLVEHAAQRGITNLTFWAFSTENWRRDPQEVEFLLQVFRTVLEDPMVQRLKDNGVQVRVIGDMLEFPEDIQKKVAELVTASAENKKIIVNFALNYGGRQEIVQAVNSILTDRLSKVGHLPITAEDIETYLYTHGQPDPDLIIRTGGEQRLSGYLPWQSIYSELYFTPTLWPDFSPEQLDLALEDYASRQRRFGK